MTKTKKTLLYLLINIPFTYLLFSCFGWTAYFIIGGNPTFFVPFGTLLMIFSSLTIMIAIGFITLFKIYTPKTVLITIIEIVVIYILLWSLFK